MLQRLASIELDVAATAIGVAPDVLRRVVDDGRSISALAADAGVPPDRVVDAVLRDANTKVDRAIADGRITPDRASMLRNRLPNWAEQLVRANADDARRSRIASGLSGLLLSSRDLRSPGAGPPLREVGAAAKWPEGRRCTR